MLPSDARPRPHLQYYPANERTVRRIPVQPLPFLMGRGGMSHLAIPAEGVSKRHAEIFQSGDSFFLRDLGSTNGTLLNGKRIETARLDDNDVIHLAHEELRFALDGVASFDGARTQPVKGCTPLSFARGSQYLQELLDQRDVRFLFQPIVHLHSRQVLGYEALARGMHAHLSIKPTDLFRLAERCGIADSLSRMCRQVAVTEASRLPGSGYLFLNLHPAEMTVDSLLDSLAGLMAAAPAGWRMVLEVHENSTADLATWRRLHQRLKQLGIQIAYDDFGTGHARFLELAELRPDFIKLDMGLVRDIHLASGRQNLLHALTSASQELQVQVIAEGLESEAEAAACQELGCQFGQGYLFGRPQGLTLAGLQLT